MGVSRSLGLRFDASDSYQLDVDAHVYGAFNLAFGLGSAIGPIIGGPVGTSTVIMFDDAHGVWIDF